MYAFIGVDPGSNGCLSAMIGDSLWYDVLLADFNDDARCIWILDYIKKTCQPENTHALVELIQLRSRDRQGTKSAQAFGFNTGVFHGMLRAYGINPEQVTPQKWQNWAFKHVEPIWRMEKGAKKKDTKEMSRREARIYFPDLADKYLKFKKDHNRADSLNIVRYCREIKSIGNKR